MSQPNTLGVIGGLGPMATAYFMELVTAMTDAKTDQEHLPMVVFSSPSIPDRTAHILDPSQPDPLPQMLALGQTLARLGADVIAIPCVTAHYFWQRLCPAIPAPILNAVEETARELAQAGIRRVGLLATGGTLQAGIFRRSLEDRGIELLVPDPADQKLVMHLIYNNIKAGVPAQMELFAQVTHGLFRRGAQAIILGCTELSMIHRDHSLGPEYLDVMQVLAQRAILACGKPVKPEYLRLVTPKFN